MSQPKYTRLTLEERIIIENRFRNGENPTKIASSICRAVSTVTREIRRNSTKNKNKTTRVNEPTLALADARNFRCSLLSYEIKDSKRRLAERKAKFKANMPQYKAQIAQRKAVRRLCKEPTLLLDSEAYEATKAFIKEKLKERWSPEQISGRIKTEGNCPYISFVSIYKYIYHQEDKTRSSLISCLRHRGKPYRHEKPVTFNQTNRSKHSIHDRPDVVEQKVRLGDLEGDTIVGKDTKDRLLTHNDRLSGVVSISLIRGFDANKISATTAADVERVFDKIKTITYDNGIEFSCWRQTEQITGSTIYFADPYTPSQRGANENLNGLIRDFLPKGSDFKKIKKSDILDIESKLNNRPRKRLGFLTPLEFAKKLSFALAG